MNHLKTTLRRTVFAMLAIVLVIGCSGCTKSSDRVSNATFQQISPEDAMQRMKTESNFQIVDVRRQEEYAAGHIPDAICIPNESIGTEPVPELPDLDQMLLIYCRSGRRSKEAAQKLADIGYTNVYEFGGILDWPGEIIQN